MAAHDDDLAVQLIRRLEHKKSARGNFNMLFQQVRDNVIPTLARFIGEDPKGIGQNQFTLDETPEQAHEMLAAAVHGMIANPSQKYVDFATDDENINEDEQCAGWLYRARDRGFDIAYAPRSGMVGAHHESILEMTSLGSGIVFSGEKIGQGLRFACRPVTECYLAEGEDGHVDTIDRAFKLTARQAAEKFKAKTPGAIMERAADPKRAEDELQFLHAVYPRADRAFSKWAGASRLPVASAYVWIDGKQTIDNSGYHEMPYAAPRWYTRAGEVYGRGPGIKALPSCKALQRSMKYTFRAADKSIEPPLMVADDGVFGPPRLGSGQLTYARADMLMRGERAPITPINTGASVELGEEFMKSIRQRIEASFYNHLIQMMRDPRMTATQVIQIAEETLRAMGPTVGRINDELIGPQWVRIFWMLMRAGAFPPAPLKLQRYFAMGGQIVIRFVSPVAQAQKLSEAKGIVQTLGVATQIAQSNPEVWDNYDLDGAARELGVLFGMPRYLIRDPDAIAQMRAARANQQRQQQAVEAAPMIANAAKNAGQGALAFRQALGIDDQGGMNAAA